MDCATTHTTKPRKAPSTSGTGCLQLPTGEPTSQRANEPTSQRGPRRRAHGWAVVVGVVHLPQRHRRGALLATSESARDPRIPPTIRGRGWGGPPFQLSNLPFTQRKRNHKWNSRRHPPPPNSIFKGVGISQWWRSSSPDCLPCVTLDSIGCVTRLIVCNTLYLFYKWFNVVQYIRLYCR